MSSGDSLLIWGPYSNEPPTGASYATLDYRNSRPCLDFDAGGSEMAQFSAVLPRTYAGGGLTVTHTIAFTSATTGSAQIQGAFERGGSVLDFDDNSFATAVSAVVNVSPNSGSATIVSIAFSDGAGIDNLQVGEYFRYKLTKLGEIDTATGDMELFAVELRET